jgi:hypothetical protein
MDRLVRYAQGDVDYRLHDLESIKRKWLSELPAGGNIAANQVSSPGEKSRDPDELEDALCLYSCLDAELDALRKDAGTAIRPGFRGAVPMPPYQDVRMSPDEDRGKTTDHNMQMTDDMVKAMEAVDSVMSRQDRSADLDEDPNTGGGRPVADNWDEARHRSSEPELAIQHGIGLEVRGAIAFARLQQRGAHTGLSIHPEHLPKLLLHTETEYKRACQILARDPSAKRCFQWQEDDSKIVIHERGYPQDAGGELRKWLGRNSPPALLSLVSGNDFGG